MGNEDQQEPQNPRVYFVIRGIAEGLVGVFDEVRFLPLSQPSPNTLSVEAVMPGDYLAGYRDIWLTLWRGGKGQMWLRLGADPVSRADDKVLLVDPSKEDFGVDLPDAGSRDATLRTGIAGMLGLLAAGIALYEGHSDSDLTIEVLNQTVDEGFKGSTHQLHDEHELAGDEGLVSDLEQLCADSELDSIDFGPYGASGPGLFATRTVLDVGDQLTMTVWSDEDTVLLIDVAGMVQRMDAPELAFPGKDQDEADMVAEMADQLAEIHDVASTIFEELNPHDPQTAFDLLNSVAFAAMIGAAETSGPHSRPWHRLADHFGEHCRLGFLAGVMLEESPFGNLNIRASTIDPVTRATTDLQVYWKQDDEQDEPEHWLSVGTSTGPAHDVDLEYPDLLSGIPEASRDYIRHAISHLHDMVHLAGGVLEARTAEALAYLDLRKAREEVPDAVEHEMVRSTIDDAIAGLNGVARLYTGAMPGN